MPGLNAADAEGAVRVVVAPSQSSYFAGEPFSVTITFTNTRSPESSPSRPPGHKRGAHSISSAPLARPPTSPGTPRTAVPTLTTQAKIINGFPPRRGLVGKSGNSKASGDLPDMIEQRRKKLLAKSLSVSISPQELENQVGESTIVRSASYAQQTFSSEARISPASPRVSSPLTRSESLTLSSSHPHARKQSLFDGQTTLESITIAGAASPIPTTSTSTPSHPYTPASSTSTFSLALDPIAESSQTPFSSTTTLDSPVPQTPYSPAFPPTDSLVNGIYGNPPSTRHARRQSQLGLGQPPTLKPQNIHVPPRSAFSSTFPQSNTELILYSYAQLKGTVTVMPLIGTTSTAEQTHTLRSMRASLLKRPVVGGGSMDISSSLQKPPTPSHRRRPTHGRSPSFSSGLLSLLSPTTLVASASTPPPSSSQWTPLNFPQSSSTFSLSPSPGSSRFPSSNGAGVGLGLGISRPATASLEEDIDPEVPLPTIELQPSMLAVDLSLLPGESRSYTYSVILPDSLPPTFKGKSLKFSYELVVGTCRASPHSNGPGSTSANSLSRVMKIPIRVYNHVAVGRTPRPYDLLWPVLNRSNMSYSGSQVKVVEETGQMLRRFGKTPAVPSPLASSAIGGTYEDLQDYARRLLTSFPEPGTSGVRIKLPAEAISPISPNIANGHSQGWQWQAEEGRRMEREREDGELSGCREAVEILTRNPKKASYDVTKEGVKVAILTFPKAAYRLGETVLGVVEINQRTSRTRVLQLSAMLEAHESLPSSIAQPTTSRQLRRVHAEHHSSFTSSVLRTTFSLDIPSDASPAFQVRVGQPQPGGAYVTLGGLEWKVRLCLLVAVAAESSETGTEGVRMKNLVRNGARGEWGTSWRAPRNIAPLEKPPKPASQAPDVPSSPLAQSGGARSWASFLASSFLGTLTEDPFQDGDVDDADEENVYDGIKPDRAGGVGAGVNFDGGDSGWKEVKLETVECEVPIKLWPGNTAFKALDIVFDV